MKFKKFIPVLPLLLVLFVCVLIFPVKVKGQEINCPNRYVTFVNPVRGRDLWSNKNISSLTDQYSALAKYNFPATWLLQYDAITDNEITDTIKNFKVKGETGVFLEISRNLAEDAGVASPLYVRWSDPGTVFLSAYSQSERRLLIDKIYSKFKEKFGYYPKSVGSWWIDSYSLDYIKSKYGLDAVMIVADQKTTDSYGVWGQWWGMPYHPSDLNILVPGNSDMVVIQWAQRDPVLAYGEGSLVSNFSVQANDYIRSGKDTTYFGSLIKKYLDCQNKIGQTTVGLETGMEASEFHDEYLNQLSVLDKIENLKAVTMSGFSKIYESVYPKNPTVVKISDWILTPAYRQNSVLGDKINYKDVPFQDFFVADKNGFLDRNLNNLTVSENGNPFPVWIMAVVVLAVAIISKHKRAIVTWSILFGLISYGLIFRSGITHGWEVFYGPVFNDIILFQIVILFLIIDISLILNKYKFSNLFFWLVPLSYGFDWVAGFIRYTKIQGVNYFGLVINRTNFVGVRFGNQINFVAQKYSPTFLGAFLKIPFEKIFNNLFLYVFFYPIIHIFLGLLIYMFILKLPSRFRYIFIFVLAVLFILQAYTVLTADPRVVFAVK